jgi:uncharacterized protein (DUF342 family)
MADELKENGNENSDAILRRLEKQLDDIETGEILHEMTRENLEEKGFIGSKPIEISHGAQKTGTEEEHLVLENGVEFIRLLDSDDIDALEIESLAHYKNLKTGQLIATRNSDEQSAFGPGRNVVKKVKGPIECYYAGKNGFVVIFRKALHVVPSDVDCSIRIRTSNDKMHVFMDCAPGYGNGKTLSSAVAKEELRKSGIIFGIDEKILAAVIDKANATMTRQKDVCVAFGTSAKEGEPGRVEFSFSTVPQEYDFHILPDGRIDYKSSTNILMAEKDKLLARIFDPKEGVAGVNVLGEKVPANAGKTALLTAGNGVRKTENGKEFYADINGSIVLNGTIIEVVNTYVVNGDVDYSTGNIQFNGNVVINGTVPDGFEVKADGDIVVMKIVESARLEAGRDIIIKGGVQGKGKGLVSAGRDVRVGYAQNARMEAEGNIYIDNFAINSYIFTSKCLIMKNKKGAVIGGEVFAQRGIDVKALGSETGAKTMVDAGNDYLALRRLAEIDNVIDFCKKNIVKIEESLRPLLDKIKSGEGISSGMKGVIPKALEKKKSLDHQRAIMIAKRSDLYEQSQEKDVCYVKVSQACYPDVMIKIKDLKKSVTAIRENVRFYEDRKTGEIAVGAY